MITVGMPIPEPPQTGQVYVMHHKNSKYFGDIAFVAKTEYITETCIVSIKMEYENKEAIPVIISPYEFHKNYELMCWI